jgi:hypothetical protein
LEQLRFGAHRNMSEATGGSMSRPGIMSHNPGFLPTSLNTIRLYSDVLRCPDHTLTIGTRLNLHWTTSTRSPTSFRLAGTRYNEFPLESHPVRIPFRNSPTSPPNSNWSHDHWEVTRPDFTWHDVILEGIWISTQRYP